MANPNDTLLDELVRHAVYLGRYTKAEVAAMMERISGANESLILEIMRGASPDDRDRLLKKIEDLYGTALRQATEQLEKDAKELAAYEATRAAKVAEKIGISFALPAPTKVLDAVMENPADRGNTMRVLFEKFERNTVERIQATIRQGLTEGQGPVQMVKALRGEVVKPARWIVKDGKKVLRPGVYRGGVYETTSRGAETLARTVVMHVYNTANETVYQDNADLLSSVKWIATLDMNTCPDCAALDGQEWPVDNGHPTPPLHPNCRCVLSPQVKGHVHADSPRYEAWLAKQSQERQDDILGKGRAEIFRSGGKLSDMSDQGAMLTLAELKEREA
jgi:SPP1 gp7 family putative phage head morphogenesis protein